MTDPIRRLHDADPAARAGLGSLSDQAWADLQHGVLSTRVDPAEATRAPAPRRRRRVWRTTAIALAVVGTLTAAAWAWVPGFFGGSVDGPNCLLVWGDPDTLSSAPWLTGDPIADCQVIWGEAGVEPPADLTAFELEGMTFVTPTDQVPQDAAVIRGAAPASPAVVELRLSLVDGVDGGMSRCFSLDEGTAWAQGELDRLGLADTWTVETHGSTDAEQWAADGIDRPCAGFDAGQDGVLSVYPAEDLSVVFPDGNPRADALRTGITEQCLTLDGARAVVDDLLAQEDHHWPTTSVVDESASCARVDLAIGGSIQVTVYGPTSTG